MTAARGCFPMDGVVAVAGNVLAQLLEFATLAELAHGAHAGAVGAQKKGGDLLALAFEIGIGAHLNGLEIAAADVPETGG